MLTSDAIRARLPSRKTFRTLDKAFSNQEESNQEEEPPRSIVVRFGGLARRLRGANVRFLDCRGRVWQESWDALPEDSSGASYCGHFFTSLPDRHRRAVDSSSPPLSPDSGRLTSSLTLRSTVGMGRVASRLSDAARWRTGFASATRNARPIPMRSSCASHVPLRLQPLCGLPEVSGRVDDSFGGCAFCSPRARARAPICCCSSARRNRLVAVPPDLWRNHRPLEASLPRTSCLSRFCRGLLVFSSSGSPSSSRGSCPRSLGSGVGCRQPPRS